MVWISSWLRAGPRWGSCNAEDGGGFSCFRMRVSTAGTQVNIQHTTCMCIGYQLLIKQFHAFLSIDIELIILHDYTCVQAEAIADGAFIATSLRMNLAAIVLNSH